jgi:small GTP-binding protein
MESNDSSENTTEFNVKKKNIILDTSEYNITPIKDTGELEEVMKEITYKIIIIGDQGVGKSTIIQNLTEKGEKQSDQYRATIGFDIFHYSCKVKDKIIKLQIWDTCGLEEFHSLTPNLYKNALLVIIVYSIPNRNTFEDVEKWINILKKNSQPETLVFIVGNKKDLENERDVTEDEGKKYVEDNNLNFFIETSAKSGAFVDKLFEQAFAKLYEYKKSYENDKDNDEDRIDFSRRKGTFKVKSSTKKVNQKGKHCC